MLSNGIAIVGIDSQFGEFANIDRVARALYVGRKVDQKVSCCFGMGTTTNNTNSTVNSTLNSVINSVIIDSTARMFDAFSFNELAQQENNLVPAQLDVIVINERSVEKDNEKNDGLSLDLGNYLSVKGHINSVVMLSQLSEALTLALSLIDKGRLVALVGINLDCLTKKAIEKQRVNAQVRGFQIKHSDISNTHISNTMSFDSHFSGYQSASGVASLLLTSQAIAQHAQLPIYAQLNGLSVSSVNATAMKEAVLESLKSTNEKKAEQKTAQQAEPHISLVEVSALEDVFHSELESSVLLEAYSDAYFEETADKTLTCAISSARSITGEGAGFSQVLGLLRTVIALQQRYIPGIKNWQTPKPEQLERWKSSSFYFPTESRTRYLNADGSKHSAAYSCLTQDSYCHLVLTEHTLESNTLSNTSSNTKSKGEDIRLNGFLASSDLHLVLVNGENEAELQQKLLQLVQLAQLNLTQSSGLIESYDDLKMIADHQYQQYLTLSTTKYTVAFLAESIEELIKEIQLAQQGIKNIFVNLSQPELGKTTPSSLMQWKTPKGSYFSAQPASPKEGYGEGTSNNVCFMYPGIGATYVGLGRDLFQLFPEIYTDVADLVEDMGSSLKDTLLNPRSISRLDFQALKQRDVDLRGNLADIAEAGVGFACVFSKIFTKVFKLNADFATGYSMGEVSMYAALGCWQQPGLMSVRLANSATFNERLCGDLLTLREHWDLPLPSKEASTEGNKESSKSTDLAKAKTKNKAETPIWETYTIKATLAQVEAACIGETRVYCTIINTPDSVLLAGYPADCLRVIDKLGVRAMALNIANAIHSAPAKAEYDDMVALYTMAVNARINTKLYSSSCYLPVPQLSKAIANAIAKCLCDRVDFPRLVNTLYNNGARVFIEMGAGRSLCSWVDKTLEHMHQKHIKVKGGSSKISVSVPVNAKGVSDELTYFRAIAKLVSHGVKLDLNRLFYGSIVMKSKSLQQKSRTTPNKKVPQVSDR
jgi:acyl transferase domain-containing protein